MIPACMEQHICAFKSKDENTETFALLVVFKKLLLVFISILSNTVSCTSEGSSEKFMEAEGWLHYESPGLSAGNTLTF